MIRKLAFVAALLTLSAPVFASSGAVSLSGMDLSDPAQVAKLHQAIVRTAEKVCKAAGNTAPSELRVCIREAVDRAVNSNAAAQLKTWHASLPGNDRYRVDN